MVNMFMSFLNYSMLIYQNWRLCVSAQSFKEFSQLLNMVEEERRRLVRCFLFFYFEMKNVDVVY